MPRAHLLRCEYLDNPLGLDEVRPRLSWQMDDPRPGARQTAYQIIAASTREKLVTRPDLWDTGKISGDRSLDVAYAGKKLGSAQKVWWRVRIWDAQGRETDWSGPAFFMMGLLKPGDWKGKWIGRPIKNREGAQPCPYLRRTFAVRNDVVSAHVFVTARGLFELHLNGQRVGKDYFTPGWTVYRKRIQYLVYDVTSDLKAGPNAFGAVLADGWYAGRLGWGTKRFVDGDQLSLLLQLQVEYADGTSEVLTSDADWKTSLGPIQYSDIYDGETYDAREEMAGWDTAEFHESGWEKAHAYPAPKTKLVAKRGLPVRRHEELTAETITEPTPGAYVFDLAQNMVGWARIKVRAAAGTKIKIRFAEMLQADGNIYTENLRTALCTDHYICRGGGEEVFEPHFTFHGFRYVELSGLAEKPAITDVVGIVLHSDIPATGSFECSDPMVNRLQKNIQWGQKGNFLEVPTDCPQRDERLGWTGDAQVFIRTASFNCDVAAFFTKWCIDLADEQWANGAYPHVAPDPLRDGGGGAAAWSDAGVICPWTVYLCYADKEILERQYDSMKRWVGWQHKKSVNLVHNSACFGDWLSVAYTPPDLISSAYFAHTANLTGKVAAILGKKADAKKYGELFKKVKAAFNRHFVTPDGLIAGDSQTSYLLALGFDLLPPEKRPASVSRLVRDIQKRGWRLSTGFVGTPLLNPVLTRFGHTDVAYKLLLQKEYQSWLFTVVQGATTMWERWNSYSKAKGFGDAGMNSFNHYAYGAVGEWMYNTVAGIELDPAQPGYKHIIIKPEPGEGLTWARAELQTRYGKVASGWKEEGKKWRVNVTIPPNTTATIRLPGQKPKEVAAGVYEYVVPVRKNKPVYKKPDFVWT